MNFKDVQVTFVIPENCEDETQTSTAMQDAYSACKQNIMKVGWVRECDGECIDMQKTDFLVFQEFKGELYQKAVSTKNVILGARCLLVCLLEVKPIPNVDWPLMSMAMENCVVVCSNLPKQLKEDIRIKVQGMGGHFTATLVSSNTHLVSDSVRSEKYNKAAPIGLRIMLPSWVDEVWEASLQEMVHGNDERFSKHKCPPFHNLTICTTGFTNVEIRRLEKLITENGGNYCKQLVLKNTDVLICNGSSSEKYKAARKHKIVCVSINWVIDSVNKGYGIPEINMYPVKKGTSTPTKSKDQLDPNFSIMSAIAGTTLSCSSVLQDSMNTTAQFASPFPPAAANKRKSPLKYADLVDGIDMKRVKRAEAFLDGCSVYLAGFVSEDHDKLCKVLNFSGATRFDTLSERITHIIVGDSSCHEVKLIRSKNVQCPMVSVKWVVDSIEKRQPVPEEEYLISAISSPSADHGSPLIKKGLRLLKTDVSILETDPAPKTPLVTTPEEPNQDNDIMMQYMRKSFTSNETSVKPPDCSSPSITMSMEETRLENLKFLIANFTPEKEDEIKILIEEMGGSVVSKKCKSIPDYAVVSITSTEFQQSAREVVTDLWLKDVLERKALLQEIMYYHRPCVVNSCSLMSDFVISLSGFCVAEKAFLKVVCEQLGAVVQDSLARIAKEPNILASTHLISAEDSGKKYEGAVKWGLPVVSKDWALECARTGQLIQEDEYLMGSCKENLIQGKAAKVHSKSMNKETLKSSSHLNISVNKSSDFAIASTSKCPDTTQDESRSGGDGKVGTPLCQKILLEKETGSGCNTPANNSIYCSQITPVNQIMQRARIDIDLKTPDTPKPWDHVDTPNTPYGAFLCDGTPPPELRKKFKRWLNGFPEYVERPRRLSTPLSELKRQLWDRICPPDNQEMNNSIELPGSSLCGESQKEDCNSAGAASSKNEEDSVDTVFLEEKLNQLDSMLKASASSRRSSVKRVNSLPAEGYAHDKVSQPFSVGWDENMDSNEEIKKPGLFMISGVDSEEREQLVNSLETLGANVSALQNYDPTATHLICQILKRNEKLLASMAAGKWVLHTSYVEDSVAAGKFLDEEDYEFGNPKSAERIKVDKESENRAQCVHSWRKEISKRGYGAFHDVRGIVVASKREPIIRVIEAGGGMVIDASPPFEDNVFATHCFLEVKTVKDFKDYIPLAQQGIYCLNTIYVTEFLHKAVKDFRDYILPGFQKYYS